MGVFGEHQPKYASYGIPTFPLLGPTKRPAVKGYRDVNLNSSRKLALKFARANAFGFIAGPSSGVSVIDIDSADEGLLCDALKRFGDTPVIARTQSGGYHLWYHFHGNIRRIRPDREVPIDILGGGVVVAPPSIGKKGAYEFIRGGLADIERLHPANITDHPPLPERQELRGADKIGCGSRNDALFRHLLQQARSCDTLDDLIDVAQSFAEERIDRMAGHAFNEAEIVGTAKSVWDWTERMQAAGTYFVGGGQYMTIGFNKVDLALPLGADALALYVTLLRHSDHRRELIIANDMRLHMSDGVWSLRRFRDAREKLISGGLIVETQKASTWHGPARYAWSGG